MGLVDRNHEVITELHGYRTFTIYVLVHNMCLFAWTSNEILTQCSHANRSHANYIQQAYNPALTSFSIPLNQSSLISLTSWPSLASPLPRSLKLSERVVTYVYFNTCKLDWDKMAFKYLNIFGNVVFCYRFNKIKVFCYRLKIVKVFVTNTKSNEFWSLHNCILKLHR